MKKRQLLKIVEMKTFRVTKGPKWAAEFKKLPTALTVDMLRTGEWKDMEFKAQNWNAAGRVPSGGHLHPLMKARS